MQVTLNANKYKICQEMSEITQFRPNPLNIIGSQNTHNSDGGMELMHVLSKQCSKP